MKFEIIFTIISGRKMYWNGEEFVLFANEAKRYGCAKTAIALLRKSRKFRDKFAIRTPRMPKRIPDLFSDFVKPEPHQINLFSEEELWSLDARNENLR